VQVKIQRMAAEAWVTLAHGDTARAIDEAAAAAERAYQRSLVRQPNRALSLAGLAAARRAATAP
jgi:hypothetical protein